MTPRIVGLMAITGLSIGLGSCVVSERPLIVNAKPIFGEHASAVLFTDFKVEAGYSAAAVSYRWVDGFYERASADSRQIIKFNVEPLAGGDFVVARSTEDKADGRHKIFTYLLGRKMASGAYVGVPLDDDALSQSDRNRICKNGRDEIFCSIDDHEQMVLIATATAARTFRDPGIAVLTHEEGTPQAPLESLGRRGTP